MELISLKIENFLSVKEIVLPLNTEGLILVTGVNKDAPSANANGSAKSALFEAICWCLWGETVRGLTADAVVHRLVGKDCAVALTLEDAGVTYVVSRHRLDSRTKKPNDLTVLADGQPFNAGKMKSMQASVDHLIGFDFDTFKAMMPGAGSKVADFTDLKIKELLESILQTDQLSVAYEAARERSKKLEAEMLRAAQDRTRLLCILKDLESDMQAQCTLRDQHEMNMATRRAFHEGRLGDISNKITDLNFDISVGPRLQKELEQYQARIEGVSLHFRQTKTDLYRVDKAKKEATIATLHDQATVLTTRIIQVQSTIDTTTKLQALCSSCQQQVPDDHKASLIAGLEDTRAQLARELDQITISKVLANQELQTLVVVYAKDKEDAQQVISNHTLVVIYNQKELQSIEFDKKMLDSHVSDKAKEEAALASLTNEVVDFESVLVAKAKSAFTNAALLARALKAAKEAENELNICKFWVEGFAPSGLRSFMLQYVTPILNDRAKYYSDLLTQGELSINFSTKSSLKNGKEVDKFSITVQFAHGADSYAGSSAGERARADLVIAMALGDLAQYRTAKQLLWRFLDEPFESIDQSGTEAIVRLLNDQKDKFKTVFVVTHKSDFKEHFSQHITVVKENGFSRLGAP